jgi:hypothetical protein
MVVLLTYFQKKKEIDGGVETVRHRFQKTVKTV